MNKKIILQTEMIYMTAVKVVTGQIYQKKKPAVSLVNLNG